MPIFEFIAGQFKSRSVGTFVGGTVGTAVYLEWLSGQVGRCAGNEIGCQPSPTDPEAVVCTVLGMVIGYVVSRSGTPS